MCIRDRLRIELQYWIVCCLELKDCLVFTANVEFGCWSDFPISNSCSKLKNTSIMELVVCLLYTSRHMLPIAVEFRQSYLSDVPSSSTYVFVDLGSFFVTFCAVEYCQVGSWMSDHD